MESQLSLQISRVAAEHSAEKRLEYIGRISAYEPRQLVFVDESSVDHRTTYHGQAWSIQGTKAQRKAFFVRGRWYVVTQFYQAFPYIHLVSQYFLQYHWRMALSLEDGILHCEIVEGSFRADTFALFIQNLLEHMQLFPAPNSVIVMDNCHIHKNPFIQELIAARYVS